MALAADLPAATVVPTWTPHGALALWRSHSGRLSACADRCPHRGMRLSHGFVRGETLSCIYHGWSYGQNGQCSRIPAHPDLVPPEAIRVATYRVDERNGVVWIAADDADGTPPAFDTFSPLRSLTTSADAAGIAAAAGNGFDADGVLRTRLDGVAIQLLLAPLPGPGALIHVLVESNAAIPERIKVSRAMEIIRRKAETMVQEGQAA